MLKIIISLAAVLGSLTSLAEPELKPLAPPVFTAEYSLYRAGAKVARIRRRISPMADARFEYFSETKTVGLVALFRKDHIIEKSIWDFAASRPKPSLYTYQHTGGKKDRRVSVEFDWEQLKIINTINGDAWQMPGTPEVMDKLLYQLAIMLDLEAGKARASYTIADGGKIKNYSFEKLGRERLQTPLGEFDTIKMIRYKDNRTRTVTLWCAEKLRYLPVKVENIEKDRNKTVAMIQSLTGLAY